MDIGALNIDKSNWVLTPLGDLATEVSERVDNPSESEYEEFVGLEHFVSGDLKIRQWGTTGNLTSSTKAFKSGDVLFARRNAYLKRASLVSFDGVCSGDAFVLRENHEMIVPGFLAFVVNSNALWDYANANAAGTMSKRVKWRDLANYEFRLPPKDQQAQLAELFWSMDEEVEALVKNKRRTNDLFETSRNAIFCPESGSHPLCISNDNEYAELALSKYMKGKTYNGIYKPKEFQGTGIRIINMGELFAYPIIKDEQMSLLQLTDKEKNNFLVEEGDLIFARRSLVVEGAGKCSIIGKHSTPMTFESSMIRAKINTTKINPKFIFHFLKSREGKRRIRKIVCFTTVAGIASTDLVKVKVPHVSSSRQNAIVEYLDCYDEVFDSLDVSIKNSKALQKALINQVF